MFTFKLLGKLLKVINVLFVEVCQNLLNRIFKKYLAKKLEIMINFLILLILTNADLKYLIPTLGYQINVQQTLLFLEKTYEIQIFEIFILVCFTFHS